MEHIQNLRERTKTQSFFAFGTKWLSNVIVFGYTQIINFYFLDFTQIILPSENFREISVKNRRLHCQIEDNKYLPSDFLAILSIKIEVFIYSVIPDFVYREFL